MVINRGNMVSNHGGTMVTWLVTMVTWLVAMVTRNFAGDVITQNLDFMKSHGTMLGNDNISSTVAGAIHKVRYAEKES